jgi:indolepyruvate ferredoxin oxidoreductase, beta subunit
VTNWSSGQRPITIAILAMGGEGGGVLADWIVAVGENAGWYAQNTSVAGVAQRTGATVYYVELYPRAEKDRDNLRSEPVLSLFPTPGEVDIVLASELMEAGRAVQRGFATPDRTTLIASTNRVYSIDERLALGDGRADSTALLAAAQAGAKRLVAADFMALAQQAGSVISAALLGALSGCGALPFARTDFEAAIEASGKGVEASLRAFNAGFEAAAAPPATPAAPPRGSTPVPLTLQTRRPLDPAEAAAQAEQQRRRDLAATDPGRLVGPHLQPHARRVAAEFPGPARDMLLLGCVRTAVYQDTDYTELYLQRVARVAAVDPDPEGEARLTVEAARHIALWMTYQDTIHVAHQKIRRHRIAGVRREAGATEAQIIDVREYLHPQLDEITDTLPTALGRRLAHSRPFARVVGKATGRGLVINTTGIIGYSMLWTMARFRPLRPRTFRFAREQEAVDAWLERAVRIGRDAPELACEIIECQRVLKGYGATHQHGQQSFALLMSAVDDLTADDGRADAAAVVRTLREAALADEDGHALRDQLAVLGARNLGPVAAAG